MPLRIVQGVKQTTSQRRHFMIISSPVTDVVSNGQQSFIRQAVFRSPYLIGSESPHTLRTLRKQRADPVTTSQEVPIMTTIATRNTGRNEVPRMPAREPCRRYIRGGKSTRRISLTPPMTANTIDAAVHNGKTTAGQNRKFGWLNKHPRTCRKVGQSLTMGVKMRRKVNMSSAVIYKRDEMLLVRPDVEPMIELDDYGRILTKYGRFR